MANEYSRFYSYDYLNGLKTDEEAEFNGSVRFNLGGDTAGDMYFRSPAGILNRLGGAAPGQTIVFDGSGLPSLQFPTIARPNMELVYGTGLGVSSSSSLLWTGGSLNVTGELRVQPPLAGFSTTFWMRADRFVSSVLATGTFEGTEMYYNPTFFRLSYGRDFAEVSEFNKFNRFTMDVTGIRLSSSPSYGNSIALSTTGGGLSLVGGAFTLTSTSTLFSNLNDSTGIAKMVVSTNGLLSLQPIPGGGGGGGAGTVTSVGITMSPSVSSIFDISGSPITTSGNFAFSLDNQNASTVFAGPSSGGAATPLFRALATADIPTLPMSKIGWGGSTAQYVRGDGGLVTFPTAVSAFANDMGYISSASWAAITGKPNSGDFIFNQSASAQAASLWINGTAVFNQLYSSTFQIVKAIGVSFPFEVANNTGGYFRIGGASSGTFLPYVSVQPFNSAYTLMRFRSSSATGDTGTVPTLRIDATTSGDAALATKPLVSISTAETDKFIFKPNGEMQFPGYSAYAFQRMLYFDSSNNIQAANIQPFELIVSTATYNDPAWLTGLAYSKITGVTGNSKYVGTNASGVFGVYDLPSSGGGGSVTNFSAGDLSPLFTTSEATTTTTPALSFALNTQVARRVFMGPDGGADAAPTFRLLVAADIPTLAMSKISWSGSTAQVVLGDGTLGTYNAGTVTNFSAGDLSPLFTTTESTTTTTPALAFALNAQVARRVFMGPDGGADAAPTFRLLVAADIPTLAMSKINWTGTTSQYVRGDGSLASFPTNVSSFANDMGYLTTVSWASITSKPNSGNFVYNQFASAQTADFWVSGAARADGGMYANTFYVSRDIAIGTAVDISSTDGGYLRLGGAASVGYMPYINLAPDGTGANYSLLTAQANDSGADAVMKFNAASMTATTLTTKHLFSFTNNLVDALIIKADGRLNLPMFYAGTTSRVLYIDANEDVQALANGSNGNVLTLVAGVPAWAAPAGGGGGTVTNFSAGDLSPLFTTTEATTTTTPALSFALNTQVARRVFMGPDGGADAAPTFRLLVAADIPTLAMSKISWSGSTAQVVLGDGTLGTYNAGTVTNFSAGDLSPLFTTTEATTTTTPALSFSLNTQTANLIFAGPSSGVAAAPSFRAMVAADIPANLIADTHIRQGAATSVIGRSANSIGNVADIAASADNQVLRRVSGTVGFGTIDAASIGSGTMATARLGSGTAAATNMLLGNSTWGLLPGDLIDVQVFNASGTWTKPAGCTRVVVICVGGGGGGGGVTGVASSVGAAGGGGGGGWIQKYISSGLGATEVVTVGTGGGGGAAGANNGTGGGTSGFGTANAYCSATGGTGGTGQAAGTTAVLAAGGTGGAGANGASGGSVQFAGTGDAGGSGLRTSGTFGMGGIGGSSWVGGGSTETIVAAAGTNGNSAGAGGSGALSTAATNRAGGNGVTGVVIVYSYT